MGNYSVTVVTRGKVSVVSWRLLKGRANPRRKPDCNWNTCSVKVTNAIRDLLVNDQVEAGILNRERELGLDRRETG